METVYEATVGMGATMSVGSDRYGVTAAAVGVKNGRPIVMVQFDDARNIP